MRDAHLPTSCSLPSRSPRLSSAHGRSFPLAHTSFCLASPGDVLFSASDSGVPVSSPKSCPVAVQFLKAVAERGPWGTQLERAHTALQDGDLAGPLQMYAALAEGGYEVAQSNVAFLLDQHGGSWHRPPRSDDAIGLPGPSEGWGLAYAPRSAASGASRLAVASGARLRPPRR